MNLTTFHEPAEGRRPRRPVSSSSSNSSSNSIFISIPPSDHPPAPGPNAPLQSEVEAPRAPQVAASESGPDDDFVLRLYRRDLAMLLPPAPAEPGAEDALPLDEAGRQALVLGHLPKVVRLAFDYQGFGLPLGDLINEGNLGLMRAAELYDPARNVRFAYYAKPWIRVQMQRALSYQAWPVSLPADFSWRRGQVHDADERLCARLDRRPSDLELADECHLELPAVRRLRAAPAPSFVPLESPWPGNESELTLAEIIPDDNSPVPDTEAARHSDREFVEQLLATLAPNEQRVIRLRYGLEDGCSYTLAEIGQLLGYCPQGVHRLQSAALAKLRQRAQRLRGAPPATTLSSPTRSARLLSLSSSEGEG